MEVIGEIKVIRETATFGASGFRKRELVVITDKDGDYPQPILIEFVQDKCDLLDAYNVGQEVKIAINLRGRLWESPDKGDVYFNSIQGWRIEKLEAAPKVDLPKIEPLNDSEPDDLPF